MFLFVIIAEMVCCSFITIFVFSINTSENLILPLSEDLGKHKIFYQSQTMAKMLHDSI